MRHFKNKFTSTNLHFAHQLCRILINWDKKETTSIPSRLEWLKPLALTRFRPLHGGRLGLGTAWVLASGLKCCAGAHSDISNREGTGYSLALRKDMAFVAENLSAILTIPAGFTSRKMTSNAREDLGENEFLSCDHSGSVPRELRNSIEYHFCVETYSISLCNLWFSQKKLNWIHKLKALGFDWVAPTVHYDYSIFENKLAAWTLRIITGYKPLLDWNIYGPLFNFTSGFKLFISGSPTLDQQMFRRHTVDVIEILMTDSSFNVLNHPVQFWNSLNLY